MTEDSKGPMPDKRNDTNDGGPTVPLTNPDQGGDPLLGRVLDGRFMLRLLLGRGGMGRVYLAEDQRLRRRVALKLMDAALTTDGEFLQRFKREALVQAQAAHPGIVQVLDAGESAEGSYIVLEYSEGRPLSALMKLGAMRRERALDLIEQLLEVLDFAHRQGIVHRDLKPGNILVEDRGGREIVRVLDFGIAKHLQTEMQEEGVTLTRPGFGFGTPGYMSLEQATGRPTDHRTDIYAVGTILYRLLGGELPIQSKGGSDYLVQLATTTPRPLTEAHPELGIPPELDAIVLKALAREPGDRTPSALHFLNELKEFGRTEDAPTARTEGPRASAKSVAGRKASARAGAGRANPVAWGAALLCIAGSAFFVFRARAGERDARDEAARAMESVATAERAMEGVRNRLRREGLDAADVVAGLDALLVREAAARKGESGVDSGLKAERDAAVREGDSERTRATESERRLETAKADLSRAEGEVERQRTEIESLRSRAERPDAATEGLRTDIAAVRSERDRLRTDVAAKESERKTAADAAEALRLDVARLEGEVAAERLKHGAAELLQSEKIALTRQIESLNRDLAAARAARPAGAGPLRFPLRIENASSVTLEVLGLSAFFGAGASERSSQVALPSVSRVLSGKSMDLTIEMDAPLLRIEARVAKFVRAGSATPGPPETLRRNDLVLKDGELVLTIK